MHNLTRTTGDVSYAVKIVSQIMDNKGSKNYRPRECEEMQTTAVRPNPPPKDDITFRGRNGGGDVRIIINLKILKKD